MLSPALEVLHTYGVCYIQSFEQKKQHKHKLFGPDFPRTFLTLTPECPGVKKCLPTTGAAGKRTFWCGRPRFSARTSMTRRVVEKLCTKKVCVDFWPLIQSFEQSLIKSCATVNQNVGQQLQSKVLLGRGALRYYIPSVPKLLHYSALFWDNCFWAP